MFLFPVSVPPIREKWNQFVLQNSLNLYNIKKHSVLCSAHFHPSSFLKNNNKIKFLKKNAAPTLIVSRVKSGRNDYSEIVVSAPELNLVEQQANSSSFEVQRKLVKNSRFQQDLETTAESEQSSSLNNSITNKQRNSKASFLAACKINTNDTSRRQFLKRGSRQLNNEIQLKNKLMMQMICYWNLLENIKTELPIGQKKNLGKKVPKKYSPEVRHNFSNDKSEVAVFLDPAHMIKLIRNAFFKKKKLFLDGNNKIIDFDYVRKLFLLQKKKGSHLANKLRKQHIFFYKQKMKMKLATQLFSQSVTDALKFCKNSLHLKECYEADPTIKFIEMFNNGFHILNSRSIHSVGYKKALYAYNIRDISEFSKHFITYIQELKLKEANNEFVPVLESSRKTGFLGFIMDHLELFFGNVRSLGGHNNNPTTQFQSAYKKLVIRINDIQSFNSGNCISLEDIDILHYSSADPIKTINSFVVHKLTSTLHCDKGGNIGGLTYPSEDVILTCLHTEKILRSENYQNKAINTFKVQTIVLNHFLFNQTLFESIKSHSADAKSPLSDHVTLLINLKKQNEHPSLRTWYNKLILFRGQ
ncbi:THAP-type domain-containing protein [Aphis craccivora]|uniref:THAP-type domain-containing protein n=1 Tax=Aphis craccivora TaxID=307492 RepID=A0A6G0WZG8_APHCR|nr:THAP-type domain-containing protein [Aphis craccivora]